MKKDKKKVNTEEVEDKKEIEKKQEIKEEVEDKKESIDPENPNKEDKIEEKESLEKKGHWKKESEEVCETFNIEKDGKEELVRTCSTDSSGDEKLSKEQIQSQDKILKSVLIGIAILSITLISMYFLINSSKQFEYEGVKFEKIKEGTRMTGNLILYQTSVPIKYQGQIADYSFYLRNDPRKLEDIPFNGELNLKKNIVLNATDDFHCNGDGIIAIANMVKQFELFGAEIMKDENATCDSESRYSFIQIQPGETNSIEETSPFCYTLNINKCNILKVTEKFMLEGFINLNNKTNG